MKMKPMQQNITKVMCVMYVVYLISMWKQLFPDPDLITSRLLAQEKRTQLLQEKYDKDADRYKEKQEEVHFCIYFLMVH